MLLSERIREGAKLNAQGFGSLVAVNPSGDCRTCALGAAYVHEFGAHGNLDEIQAYTYLETAYGLSNIWVKRPVSSGDYKKGISVLVIDCIMFLNDHMRWTREKIADWLEKEGF